MGLHLLVNPLPLNSVNEVCYYLSCAALITLLLFRKHHFTLRTPLTIGVLLFFVWAVLGLLPLDFSNTLHDLRGYLLEYPGHFLSARQFLQLAQSAGIPFCHRDCLCGDLFHRRPDSVLLR